MRILSFGAAYGSLLGAKCAAAGHDVHYVCQSATAALINRDGTIVHIPVKGRSEPVTLRSTEAKGRTTASMPGDVDVAQFDMAILGMQEPQYASPGVRELLTAVGKAGLPTLSIMNMPPLPYLARLPGLDVTLARAAYGDPEVWDAVAPETITLCSPDPQAVRPQGEPANTLVVRLPTNFKAATFARAADAAKLTQLGADVDAVQADGVDLPVKLKVHDSVFVPLAKWAMLLAGNYRCVGADGMRPIREAVHADLAASKRVYEYVVALCVRLGADAADMVPFEKYAAAATSLANPSSAARSLAGGATAIERVDKLVQSVGRAVGQTSADVDATVALVDGWLKKNRVGSQSQ